MQNRVKINHININTKLQKFNTELNSQIIILKVLKKLLNKKEI